MDARFDRGARGGRGIRFARQEQANRRKVARRSVEVDAREFAREQFAGRLAEHARAVAGPAVGGARAAMHHRRGGLQREPHDVVGAGSAEIRDEADAAGIVFFGQTERSGGRTIECDRDGCDLSVRAEERFAGAARTMKLYFTAY